jgi:hypothetical protein
MLENDFSRFPRVLFGSIYMSLIFILQIKEKIALLRYKMFESGHIFFILQIILKSR